MNSCLNSGRGDSNIFVVNGSCFISDVVTNFFFLQNLQMGTSDTSLDPLRICEYYYDTIFTYYKVHSHCHCCRFNGYTVGIRPLIE
jgi:hypothetical protein